MIIKKIFIFKFVIALAVPGLAMAAGKHAGHSGMDHAKMTTPKVKPGALKVLKSMPKSGKAREFGADGRAAMESTEVRDSLARRCALASRGVIMLDNATWKKCGRKPKGAALGAGYYPAIPPWNKAGTGKPKTMDHSKMDHSGH